MMKREVICGDCVEVMEGMEDGTFDLLLTDPPYGIGYENIEGGKAKRNEWDRIDDYEGFTRSWLSQAVRLLKDNGVAYIWNNSPERIADVLKVAAECDLAFMGMCVWDKGDTYRALSWAMRDPDGDTTLRSWFSVCEYCLHFFKAPKAADSAWKHTGLDRINSNPECYRDLKDWYFDNLERMGLTEGDILESYQKATGKSGAMFRHYFKDSQFCIPTEKVWHDVFEPLGFLCDERVPKVTEGEFCSYEDMRRSYEDMRRSYEDMRRSYEDMRNYHRCDAMHCNIWHRPPLSSRNRTHPCEKPVDLLERLVRVSCRPGGRVLDPFCGTGSAGVSCVCQERGFVGIEKDERYCETARERITQAEQQPRLFATQVA